MTESPNDKSCVPNELSIKPATSVPRQSKTAGCVKEKTLVVRANALDQKPSSSSNCNTTTTTTTTTTTNNNNTNSNTTNNSSNSSKTRVVVLPTPSMASTMSFADWRQASNEGLMATAESLLDKLEGVAELLMEIDEKYITEPKPEQGSACETDTARASVISRFHEGVESARGVVGMLKREKWRLSKREMSVELRMGELEDYKSHLRNDMSSLNQTVDALSMRVVQLENELVEAQEVQETLEAEIAEYKNQQEKSQVKISALQCDNEALRKEVKLYRHHTNHTLMTENELLKNEVLILQDENQRLKELVRNAETHQEYDSATDGEYLSRLTRDFMRQLSSLEVENTIHGTNNNNVAADSNANVTTTSSS